MVPAPLPAAAWRGRLPYHAFRAGQALTAVTPRPLAHAVASGVALALVSLRPQRLAGVRANLRHVLPDADQRTLNALARRNVRNLAKRWVDVMQMPSRPQRTSRRIYTVDIDRYERALARGRGIVAISLHFGSWELGIGGWNVRGRQMAMLAERMRPDELFERVLAGRAALGVEVVPIDTHAMRTADPATARRAGAQAMRGVVRHLRRGEVVALAIDRDLIGNGVLLPFFGSPAPIPIGIVDVAIRTGAAILPIFLIDEGRQARAEIFPEVPYDAAAPDRGAEVLRVTAEALRSCERIIRAHPEQWHVMSPIWPEDS
ncbi:MAG: lysophospholipid acyltransferase family protein [Candidatus Dormibacteria bacterium]